MLVVKMRELFIIVIFFESFIDEGRIDGFNVFLFIICEFLK